MANTVPGSIAANPQFDTVTADGEKNLAMRADAQHAVDSATVGVFDPRDNSVVQVPKDQAPLFLGHGYKSGIDAERTAINSEPAAQWATYAHHVANTSTFNTFDNLAAALGKKDFLQGEHDLDEANPNAALAGDLTGGLASAPGRAFNPVGVGLSMYEGGSAAATNSYTLDEPITSERVVQGAGIGLLYNALFNVGPHLAAKGVVKLGYGAHALNGKFGLFLKEGEEAAKEAAAAAKISEKIKPSFSEFVDPTTAPGADAAKPPPLEYPGDFSFVDAYDKPGFTHTPYSPPTARYHEPGPFDGVDFNNIEFPEDNTPPVVRQPYTGSPKVEPPPTPPNFDFSTVNLDDMPPGGQSRPGIDTFRDTFADQPEVAEEGEPEGQAPKSAADKMAAAIENKSAEKFHKAVADKNKALIALDGMDAESSGAAKMLKAIEKYDKIINENGGAPTEQSGPLTDRLPAQATQPQSQSQPPKEILDYGDAKTNKQKLGLWRRVLDSLLDTHEDAAKLDSMFHTLGNKGAKAAKKGNAEAAAKLFEKKRLVGKQLDQLLPSSINPKTGEYRPGYLDMIREHGRLKGNPISLLEDAKYREATPEEHAAINHEIANHEDSAPDFRGDEPSDTMVGPKELPVGPEHVAPEPAMSRRAENLTNHLEQYAERIRDATKDLEDFKASKPRKSQANAAELRRLEYFRSSQIVNHAQTEAALMVETGRSPQAALERKLATLQEQGAREAKHLADLKAMPDRPGMEYAIKQQEDKVANYQQSNDRMVKELQAAKKAAPIESPGGENELLRKKLADLKEQLSKVPRGKVDAPEGEGALLRKKIADLKERMSKVPHGHVDSPAGAEEFTRKRMQEYARRILEGEQAPSVEPEMPPSAPEPEVAPPQHVPNDLDNPAFSHGAVDFEPKQKYPAQDMSGVNEVADIPRSEFAQTMDPSGDYLGPKEERVVPEAPPRYSLKGDAPPGEVDTISDIHGETLEQANAKWAQERAEAAVKKGGGKTSTRPAGEGPKYVRRWKRGTFWRAHWLVPHMVKPLVTVAGALNELGPFVLNNTDRFAKGVQALADASGKGTAGALKRALSGTLSRRTAVGSRDIEKTYNKNVQMYLAASASPHSVEQGIRATFGPDADKHPEFIANTVAVAARQVQAMGNGLPRNPQEPTARNSNYTPSRSAMLRYNRLVLAVADPDSVIANPAPDTWAAVQAAHPETAKYITDTLMQVVANPKIKLNKQQARNVSVLLGQAITPQNQPEYLKSMHDLVTLSQASAPPDQAGKKPSSGPKSAKTGQQMLSLDATPEQQAQLGL